MRVLRGIFLDVVTNLYFRKLTHLVEFSNVLTFVEGDVFTAYKLDYECGGTGHAVYNGSYFCHGFKSNKIYK